MAGLSNVYCRSNLSMGRTTMPRLKTISVKIIILAAMFMLSSNNAIACDSMNNSKLASVEEVIAFFAAQNKTVLTFTGYSGAGYEDETAMLTIAADILDQHDPARTIVNIGATPDGIGAVYPLAREKGFATTGIVSTQAREYDAALSPCVQQVFYIEDDTWGGVLESTGQLSPTSSAMVAVSDIMIGIGGGEVTRDELLAAQAAGKTVRFFPADMNHQKALEKAQKKGLPAPTDFSGAASKAF